jgi:hypothetical protein
VEEFRLSQLTYPRKRAARRSLPAPAGCEYTKVDENEIECAWG